MTRESQKKEELNFAKKAGELLGERWNIDESPNENDWPDLVISDVNQKFGLEVRNLYKDEIKSGSSLREIESIRASNLVRLSEAYYKISNIPISLNILGDINRKGVSEVANILKEKAESLSEQNELDFKIDQFEIKFYITRLPMSFGQYNRWQNVGDYVGWVSELLFQKIQSAISIKESKLDKYRSNIEDVRLLLVVNRMKNSGRVKLPGNISDITSSFNVVYLMLYPEKIVRVHSN
jgi:hypothetical protein